MLYGIKANNAALERVRYRCLNLFDRERLEQTQYLDVFSLPLFAHPRFQQATQIAEHRRQLPLVQWRCLIQRIGLLLQQRQIVQRIEDEVLVLVRARMPGDHVGAVTDDHLMHIPADQHLAMAEPRRHRIIGPAIAHQRQGTDPPGALVTGIIGRCGKRLKNSPVSLQALANGLTMTA